MEFKRDKAREHGYSEDEINAYLASAQAPTRESFNKEAALAAGYSLEQIEAYLDSIFGKAVTTPSPEQQAVYQEAGQAYEEGQPTDQYTLPVDEQVISYKPLNEQADEPIISYEPLPTTEQEQETKELVQDNEPVISYKPLKEKKKEKTPDLSTFFPEELQDAIPSATLKPQKKKKKEKKIKEPPLGEKVEEYDYTNLLAGTKPPDAVSPFYGQGQMTQAFNQYNPGMGYYNNLHKGEDFAAGEGESGRFPIGGQVMSKGYDPTYGYNVQVKGQNPQEYAQMSGVDKANPYNQPQEDVVQLNHLQRLPNVNPGEYVATGSAGLKFGNTGHSTGTHLDVESYKSGDKGNYEAYRSFLLQYPELIKYMSF